MFNNNQFYNKFGPTKCSFRQWLFTIYSKNAEISVGRQVERLIWSSQTEISRGNRISWTVVQNSKMEFPRGNLCSVHSLLLVPGLYLWKCPCKWHILIPWKFPLSILKHPIYCKYRPPIFFWLNGKQPVTVNLSIIWRKRLQTDVYGKVKNLSGCQISITAKSLIWLVKSLAWHPKFAIWKKFRKLFPFDLYTNSNFLHVCLLN